MGKVHSSILNKIIHINTYLKRNLKQSKENFKTYIGKETNRNYNKNIAQIHMPKASLDSLE